MVPLTVDNIFDLMKYSINFGEAVEDSAVCVFFGLIWSQINIPNKIEYN